MNDKVIISTISSAECSTWYKRLLASRKPCPICGAIPEIDNGIFGAFFAVRCCGKAYSSNHDYYYGVISRWNKYVDKANKAKELAK